MAKAALLIAALLAVLWAPLATATELRELYRGSRALAMGGAFVALADDEEALFYNPAGLASMKSWEVHYAPMDFEISTDLLTAYTSGGNLSSANASSINALMGKNVYTHLQFAPAVVGPNFGAAILLDDQFAFLAKDKSLPYITVGLQQTNGFQAAWGTSILRRGRGTRNSDLRVGVGGKMMWRRGGYRPLTLTQLFNISRDTMAQIAPSFELGYGADLGMQYVQRIGPKFTLRAGSAFTDIGDTSFGVSDPQRNNLSAGLAVSYQIEQVVLANFAWDYRHILQNTDWRKRNHFGMELVLPLMTIYGGVNQTYLTYGVGFDAWIFKITVLSYAEELGSLAFEDGSRRYLLHMGLKFGL